MTHLIVKYEANSREWKAKESLEDFTWTKIRVNIKGKILLLVYNFSAHKIGCRLEAIQLDFLPANRTFMLQTLDKGIIRNAKVYFRIRLVQCILIIMKLKARAGINILQEMKVIDGCGDGK